MTTPDSVGPQEKETNYIQWVKSANPAKSEKIAQVAGGIFRAFAG
jgi:hypothetical protein